MMIGTVFAGLLGAVILPLVVMGLLRRMHLWNFWRWLLVLAAAGVFHIVVALTANKGSPSFAFAHHLLPTGGLFSELAAKEQAHDEAYAHSGSKALGFDSDYYDSRRKELIRTHTILSGVSLGLWLIAALVMAGREMRHTRRAEDELAAAMAEDAALPVPAAA